MITNKRDTNKYKSIVLSNKLNCLLISNKNNNIDSVALSVGVGCYDDTVIGIAHFLEHMLFMGNKKYPGAGEYFKFIQSNGGASNAYTTSNHTCYYYSIKTEMLDKSLDIFSGFFSSPLLLKDQIEKEMNAVDSEHKKNLQTDLWREEVATHEMTTKKHPVKRFSTGCLETLKVDNIHEEVVNFYKTKYSANLMYLVITSNKDITELENLITKYFTDIPNNNVTIPRNYEKIYGENKFMELVPVNNIEKLVISWEIPSYRKCIDTKPINFICHILGHEGLGSLTNSLKSQLLILDLVATEDSSVDDKTLLNIYITLTKKGILYKKLIYDSVYKYIDNLKSISLDKLYNEFKTVQKQQFDFFEIDDPQQFIIQLSSLWATGCVPVDSLISYSFIYPDFNSKVKQELKDILNSLTESNSCVLTVSPSFKNKTKFIEKWYKSEYNIYNKINLTNKDHLNLEFDTPKLNNYICSDTTIYKLKSQSGEIIDKMKYPIKYDNDVDKHIVYWRHDTSYNTPYINISIRIQYSPYTNNKTAKDKCIIELYYLCVTHLLNSYKYEFSMAGYEITLSCNTDYLSMHFFGLPEKMKTVLKEYFTRFHLKMMDISLFNDLKHELIIMYENIKLEDPHKQVFSKYNELFVKHSYSVDEILYALKTVTYDDIIELDLFSNSKRFCIIEGNILYSNIESYSQYSLFGLDTEYRDDIDMCRVVTPRPGKFHFKPFNTKELNTAVSYIYNIGYIRDGLDDWKEKTVFLNIIHLMVSSDFFDDLRTTQQLGYITKCMSVSSGNNRCGYYSFRYLVQSNHKDQEYITNAIKEFVDKTWLGIQNLDIKEFENYKNSYMTSLMENPHSLQEEAQYNYNCLINGGVFNKKKLLIKFIQSMDFNLFIKIAKQYMFENNNISIISVGNK